MDQIPELLMSHVYMKDPKFVDEMIIKMKKDAHSKLQVIADFDRTLTKYANDGHVCSTTHGVLEESKYMPESFKRASKELKEHFMPIEFDETKSIEEKTPFMVQWWTRAHALIAEVPLTKNLLKQIVVDSLAFLREECQWLFNELYRHNIPLLIFSAGLGDIIREIISCQASEIYENMKIVANFLSYNEDVSDDSYRNTASLTLGGKQQGEVTGFHGDMIHVYNKNENSIHSSNYFDNLRHRGNILLLGDSLGDLCMADGAADLKCLLKIGFLNYKVEENLDQYKRSFDVVITEDQSMHVVNAIVARILSLPRQH